MALDLSQNPYFDDYDETKDFYRLLFRPGYAVQARELTQIQTGLQKQIDRFGSYVFKNGSMVLDGQTTIETEHIKYLKLELTNFSSETIDVTDFLNTFIVDTTSRGVRAYVIAVDDGADGNSPTLMVKYVSGAEFIDGENLQTEDALYTATTIAVSSSGNGSICSIGDGIFYVNGFFARVGAQTIILERYTTTPSYRIGLEIGETVTDESQDTTLLDPALGSSNYQAPGATRYKVTLTFTKRSLTSTDDSSFIELLRVENGELLKKISYPQNSELENTLARRTYDESGNYLVRPFQIALTDHNTYANAFNVVMEAGKAYVLGYEFETIAPTTIQNERARDVANVYNYPLTVDYQNYVDVTKLSGPIALDTLAPLTIHCVNTASIVTTSPTTASATNIGTLRIRAIDYQSGANATSISTGIWRTYVMDANVASRSANCGGTGTANTIQLDSNASSVTDAYAGVKIRIVTHDGTSYSEVRQITAYDGSTKVATVSRNFSFGVPTTATIFSLDYEFKDSESFVYGSSNVITTSMDISSESKLSSLVDTYQGAYITDTDFNRSILQFPNFAIGDSAVVNGIPITNSEYYGRKLYTQSFSSNVISFTTASGITSAVNGSPLSTADAIDNILVVTTSAGTLANNQVINFAAAANTVAVATAGNTSTYTITVPDAGSQSAKVYVKVKLPYSHTLGSLRKSKQVQTANTTIIDTSAPTSVSSGITWYKQSGTQGAQVVFSSTAIGDLQTPNRAQSVYTADVISLAGVYDFGSNTATTANLPYATNLTSSYSLNNGQSDNSYDHGSITLLPNRRGPSGNTAVYLNYYEHTGSGYLTVDSYIDAGVSYSDIPTYTSPQSAQVYYLRDCVDFRPRRKNGDTAGLFDETILGTSGTNFETDFCYYLPRIDKVILTKDRTFEVIRGVSTLNPLPPADQSNAMTLYTLALPAYTDDPANIRIKYIDNRRYTMRDIGVLEKRISNLEYYTSLNLLEQDAKNQQIIDDETGLNRFKNGILVDPFKGHNIGDVTKTDYICAIDQQNQELRPPFLIENYPLTINEGNSNNYERNGSIVTISYVETAFVEQPLASTFINVNPFNTVSFIGQLKLDPSSDTWVDTNQRPDVLVNTEGDNDAWAILAQVAEREAPSIFGTVWNNWQTQWTGISNVRDQVINPQWRGWLGGLGRVVWVTDNIIQNTLADVTQHQGRTGIQTTFSTDVITRSLGNRVVDTSVVPYIRESGILFVGSAFRPNTAMYGFFDNTSVQSYLNRSNIIELSGNTANYIDTYQNGETVRVYDPATSSNLATAIVVTNRHNATTTNVSVINISAGDDANIGNVRIVNSNATFLIGETSGSNTRIAGYHHYSGAVYAGSSNTVTISNDVLSSNTASSYATKTIYITSGTGSGQSKTISSYNTSSKLITVSGTWSTNPDNTSTYSIGTLTTDPRGEISGVFSLPSNDSVRFRTGERIFRLVDVQTGDLTSSTTNGDARYFAQGLLQTTEQTILSTRAPVIRRTSLTEERDLVSTVVQRSQVIGQAVVGYWDPLAQTFLVDQNQYQNGVQVTSLRLVFKSKDENIPVQVQLRPVVNGYPHSSQIVPFSDVTLNPEDVRIVSQSTLSTRLADTTLTPPLQDAAFYTEVRFTAPVTLQTGQEYAIVLIANSTNYEVYLAQVGQNILGTDRLISSQPYLGSFFKSQNASTWTASQDQDLMFRLMRANYDVVTANVEFVVTPSDAPSANVPMDTFYITSSNLVLPNTSLSSYYATTLASGGNQEVYRPFDIENNSFFEDTLGRRVITNDNESFKVRMYLNSNNREISPLVDMERLSVLAIENRVNTLGLANSDISITSSTSTFANSNVSITISGGGGSGANAYAVITSNTLSSIVVDAAGSGYTGTPTITITGGGGTATAAIVGETSSSGGPGYARYITRKVVLSDDMDAGDLRVYLTAYKPTEANIYVYYKLLSSDDANDFDGQTYQLMTCIQGYNNVSLNSTDLKEFVFAPGTANIPSNQISYNSFTNFRYFAIKIVMTSTNTTRAPRIKNFRTIAIPSLS
jgi:hypothetical protein